MQDCSISNALAMGLLHSCTKPSMYLINMLATKAVMILPCHGTPLLVEYCLSNHYKTCNHNVAMLLTCDNFGGILLHFFDGRFFKDFYSSKTYNRSYHGIGLTNSHEKKELHRMDAGLIVWSRHFTSPMILTLYFHDQILK